MSAADDDAMVGELFARISGDAPFRAAYRRDPAAACQAVGLTQLATRFERSSHAVQRLEARASRSGLAGLVVAAVMDAVGELEAPTVTGPTGVRPTAQAASGRAGVGVGELPDATAVPAAHTGQSAVLAAALSHASAGRASPYPGDDASHREVARWMADAAERHGLPRELPVMAALVESNLRNLPYGDRASVGYFQMQTSYWLERYPGYPHKPELQLKWFIDQALAVRAKHPELARDPHRWGEWVADIEQPQASLRGRYAERLDEARALVHDARGRADPVDAALESHVQRVPLVRTNAAAPHTGGQLLVDVPAAHRASDDVVDRLKAEAQRIDHAHVPYLWGGGHAGQQPYGSPITPLDCSGAVSRVLGVDPRVAADFESWGAPGPGKRVSVFANDGHVLMEIDGHFWGTSAANPGGGAGWIPRRYISAGYLARFTVRHPPGH
jgi:hypothetical protein